MSSTSTATLVAPSPLFADFSGVGTTSSSPPAPLLPKAWQRTLVVLVPGDPEYGHRVAQWGTVTFVGDLYFLVLLKDRTEETKVTQTGQAQWSVQDDSGTLPLWFFMQKIARCTNDSCELRTQKYDLFLHDGSRVSACFFKDSFFLEIAGQCRHIALADVACLRPSL